MSPTSLILGENIPGHAFTFSIPVGMYSSICRLFFVALTVLQGFRMMSLNLRLCWLNQLNNNCMME